MPKASSSMEISATFTLAVFDELAIKGNTLVKVTAVGASF